MKKTLSNLGKTIIKIAGRAARRVCGAVVGGTTTLIVLFVLVVFFDVHGRCLPSETGEWVKFAVGAAIVLFGTTVATIAGMLWPSPFLRLGEFVGMFNVDIDF